MAKIVVNGCFGGFGLSDTAVRRYAEIAGITLYEHTDEFEFVTWATVPREEYERMTLEGDFLAANEAHFSVYNLSRTDPILVQVVEELGDAANDLYADLYIVEVPAGTQYRIDEYDGRESVMTIDDYEWSVA
jgi:hypothetical protein